MKTDYKTSEEQRARALEYYFAHRDERIAYYFQNKERYAQWNKDWFKGNRQRGNEIAYTYVRNNRKKHNARTLAFQHYPQRQVCEVGGCFELGERHHDDYDKPYEVRWLCKYHHNLLYHNNLASRVAVMV